MILRHRLRLWWKDMVRGRRKGRRLTGLTIVLTLGLVMLFFVLLNTFAFTTALEERNPALTGPFLSMIIASMVMVLLFTEVGPILHQLYLASDMELLMASPIPLRTLFLLKLGESALLGEVIGLMKIAALVGYGLAVGAPAWYYLLIIPVSAVTIVFVTALSMLVIMLAMRVIPAGRLRGILTLMMTVLGAALVLLFQTVTPANADEVTRGLEPVVNRWAGSAGWLPPTWAANALNAARDGSPLSLLANLSALTAATAALVGVVYLVFRDTFYTSWGRVRNVSSRRAAAHGMGAASWHPRIVRPLPVPVRAMIVKDWRVLRRDMRLLSLLLLPILMAGFFLFGLITDSGARLSPEAEFWSTLASLAFFPFVAATSLAVLAFGQESSSYALLHLAPVRTRQLLLAKFVANVLPVLALMWAFVVVLGIWLGASLPELLATFAMSAWVTAGLVLANIAAGALAPRFDADNPQKSVGLLGRGLALVVSILFLVASGGLFAWLVLLALGRAPDGGPHVLVSTGLLTGGVLFTVALIGLLTWRGARNLAMWQAE